MRFVFRLFCFVLFNMLTLSLSAQDRDSVDLFLPDTVRAVPVVDSVGTAQKDTVVTEQQLRTIELNDKDGAYREIRGLEPAIERARHDGTTVTAEQLARRRKALKVQEARILSRLGLTAADLEPKWNCPICHDTGFRIKDGKMCDCWRPPRRSS